MGTTKGRKFRRNNSRPTAFSFLSNITLGNESDKPPDYPSIRNLSIYSPVKLDFADSSFRAASLHSTDSSFSEMESPLPCDAQGRTHSTTTQPVITPKGKNISKDLTDQMSHISYGSTSSSDTQHHKLTRQDSEKPIASEKIKRRSNKDHTTGNMSFISTFRYYTERLYKKKMDATLNKGYVQQQLESHSFHKHRKTQSYAHFLMSAGSLLDNQVSEDTGYDPLFLDDENYGQYGLFPGSLAYDMRPSDMKKEMNEQFRLNHPEIRADITLSKIRAIKLHLLEIGKLLDLEISSVAHAIVYIEKLIIKVKKKKKIRLKRERERGKRKRKRKKKNSTTRENRM
ncbi:unnamed protein product [Rhizopus stolonifer]